MSAGLFITIAGLMVAAASSLLGVWLERDPARSPRNGVLLSVMILSAAGVGAAQASLNRASSEQQTANLARILDDLATMGKSDPAVEAYVAEQIRAQAQTNPEVIDHISDRARARGEQPSDVLARSGLSNGDLGDLGLPAARVPVAKPVVVPVEAIVVPVPAAVEVDVPPVDLATVKIGGVKLADVKIGGVKVDGKTLALKPGDLSAEDLEKLEQVKLLELKRLADLKKQAERAKAEVRGLGFPMPPSK